VPLYPRQELKVAPEHVSVRELWYFLSIIMQPMLDFELLSGRRTVLPHTHTHSQ